MSELKRPKLDEYKIELKEPNRTFSMVMYSKEQVDDIIYKLLTEIAELKGYNKVLEKRTENTNVLQQDIPIRLYIKSSYLCDKLSINEWNALFSRYENDSHAKIIDRIDDDKGHDYAIIETTLFNVLSKGAILDLKFLAAVKIEDKWVDECLQ